MQRNDMSKSIDSGSAGTQILVVGSALAGMAAMAG